MGLQPVQVRITVTIDPPGSRPGDNVTDISQAVSHRSSQGQLVTDDWLIEGCVEEAIEIAAQKVMAMVSTEYPSERPEVR